MKRFPDLVAQLRSLRQARQDEALAGGSPMKWVFVNGVGNPINTDTLRQRQWKKLIAEAGVPDFGLYGLRHTGISHDLLDGRNIFVVSREAGHSSIQVTLDRYGHQLPDDTPEPDTLSGTR